MSHSNRVFITGRSALTATGSTSDTTWDAIVAGESGIGPIQEHNLSSWEHQLGGELKAFQPAKMLPDKKLIKAISRQDVMGIYAAVQAVEHSQMNAYKETLASQEIFNDNTGVYVGSPGNKYCQQYDFLPLLAKTKGAMQDFAKQLFDEVHPMWLLRILPNNVLAYTGITYGFKGPNHNVTNHAVGGAQALLEAYHAIRSGQIQRAVVVAYDMGTEPQSLFYYEKLGVLSARHLKPFDAGHDGTVLADGAAALVLESEASVAERSALCYGELLGGHSASEAQGLFTLEAEGQHVYELIQRTLSTAQLDVQDVAMVVAHGNGNTASDDSEARAIGRTFEGCDTPVTAFKWSTGHTLCASGVLDAVLTTHALEQQCIPGIATLDTIASSCKGLSLSPTHRTMKKGGHALLINRGYASMNACLVIKACD